MSYAHLPHPDPDTVPPPRPEPPPQPESPPPDVEEPPKPGAHAPVRDPASNDGHPQRARA